MLSLHLDIPLVLPLSLVGSWTPVQGSGFGSGQPSVGVQCHCHCSGCAVSLCHCHCPESLFRVCSVTVTVKGILLLLLQLPPRIPKNKSCFAKHCPTPCCLLPRTEGIEAFPKGGTGMFSGKNLGPSLALPRRVPGEGGPLCPNRPVLRGLELHSAWWCHLLQADTPMSPQGSGTGPVPCLVLGIALGLCSGNCSGSLVLWLC